MFLQKDEGFLQHKRSTKMIPVILNQHFRFEEVRNSDNK